RIVHNEITLCVVTDKCTHNGQTLLNLSRAIFKFAADIRKMLFRYSRLCKTASDAVDAVKLEIPQGFKLLEFKMSEYFKILLC
ncbi:MAG: hypothetical protein PVF42_08030, partial [Desulfobacterales bacterium]